MLKQLKQCNVKRTTNETIEESVHGIMKLSNDDESFINESYSRNGHDSILGEHKNEKSGQISEEDLNRVNISEINRKEAEEKHDKSSTENISSIAKPSNPLMMIEYVVFASPESMIWIQEIN